MAMMTKKCVDAFARRRPFTPFEARMVDGQRYRFRSPECFIVGRDAIALVTRTGTIKAISIHSISMLRPLP